MRHKSCLLLTLLAIVLLVGTGTRMGLTFNQSKFASTTNSFFSFTPYNMSVAISVSQSILRNAFGELDRAILAYADSGRLLESW